MVLYMSTSFSKHKMYNMYNTLFWAKQNSCDCEMMQNLLSNPARSC